MHSSFHALKPAAWWFAALALVLAGCGGESSTRGGAGAPGTGTPPSGIVQTSAERYDDNVNGLITGRTLKRWIGNWAQERPAGISGNLIILQATEGPRGFRFLRPNNVDVFTYVEAGWQEVRRNGVTEVATGILSGASVDELLAYYGIDVTRDLIVCAQGAAEHEAYFSQALCWHSLRYWGVAREHLAVLNGANAHLEGDWASADFTQADFLPEQLPGQPSPPNAIRDVTVPSVKTLGADNTALQATLEDLLAVLPEQDRNHLTDGVFLWDSRSLSEYSAGEATADGLPALVPLADRHDSVQHGASRQGHPRGSLNLAWDRLIDPATGRYPSRAVLAAYLDGQVDARGQGFVDGRYQALGAGHAYQSGDLVILWCETSSRAAVAQIATAVILGLPTRLYGGGTAEWHSLDGGAVDRDGDRLLPADSPWRTDRLTLPDFPNRPERIAPRDAWSTPDSPKVVAATPLAPRILAPQAANSRAAVQEDRAYLGSTGGGSGGNGGGRPGIVLPPNPCGG